MLRHFCILCIAACSLWTAFIALLVVACSGGSSGGGGEEADGTVKLVLGKLQIPMFDSISVDVSAGDMASIHISKKSLEDNFIIEDIPEGENRKFSVKIYADSGKLVQKGEAIADIKADEIITVPISMTALFGFLRLEVSLGITNSTGVSSGKLTLENMEYDMQFENGKGIFNTGALPLNDRLVLDIVLYDSNGDSLFTGKKEIRLSSISQTETIKLQSHQGSANVEVTPDTTGSPPPIEVEIPSISRPPKNYGDLFFTEILVDPKVSGDDFEYLEIYNPTVDTLEFLNCRVARDRKTTANTYRFDIPDSLIILPMKFLLFGRDSVKETHINYKGLALANNEQSLGIFCGNIAIDSIFYSNKAENKFPITRGKAMQLPTANHKNRALGEYWCLGSSPGREAICQ